MLKRFTMAVVSSTALVCASPSMAQFGFDGCGTLEEGVECVLFRADSGGLYVIPDTSGGEGTRLRVTGTVDPSCITFCQQGNGCIFDAVVGPCEDSFEGCGTLVQGAECVLFESDEGPTYVLGDLGGFGVGDRVSVAGPVEPLCFTTCQQGDGCILANTIEVCASASCPCDSDQNGTTDVLDLLGYLGLWFLNDEGSEFDGEPGIDVRDLLAYLGCWFPASEGSCP